jgi:uncharacterized repeat protein (TIGR01451 family)
MTRSARQKSPFRVARRPLRLEGLEDRTVPAFTATLTGTIATFTGDGADDVVTFFAAGGLLGHSTLAGFNSDFDFESATAGDQTLAAAPTSTVNVNSGGGSDTIGFGSAVVAASTVTGRFNVNGEGGTDTVIWDDSTDPVARTVNIQGGIFNQVFIPFTGAAVGFGTAEVVNVLAGKGSDTVNVSEPGLTAVSLDAGDGDDLITFADGATLGGTVSGGAGTDTIDYSGYTTPVAVNLGANAPSLVAALGADQEVPPTASTATGTAAVTYNNVAHTFDVTVTVDGIAPADVTGFHIHRGAFGTNGPIIVDFAPGGVPIAPLTPTATGFTFTATGLALNPLHEAALLGGVTYVNVHTAANPDGAIRGQLVASAPFVAATGTATGTAGLSGVENATGGSGAFGDSLVGDKLANVLKGGPGKDVIVGAQGDDTMQGEADDDILIWSNGDNTDVMDGGAGADLVQVNGALGKGDVFTVGAAGARVDFRRTNLVPFALDIGTTEQFSVVGYSGDDTFTVSDLTGVTNLAGVNMAGLDGADTFSVVPQAAVTVRVLGGLPNAAPGDVLNVDTTGTTNPHLTGVTAGPADSRSGSWAFDDRQPVTFAGVEQVGGTADLSVVLADAPDPVAAGADLTYSIVVLNSGPLSATGVNLLTLVPAGTTFVSFTAPAGWTVTAPPVGGTGAVNASRDTLTTADSPQIFTLVVHVGPAASGMLSATATVSSAADANPGNDSDTEPTVVSITADLGVTKTNGTLSVVPGATTVYTIVVTNAGPGNADGVVVTDTFPGLTGVTFTAVGAAGAAGFTAAGSGALGDTLTLPAGASVTYTVTGTVAVAAGGTLTNTVTLTAPVGIADPNPANNTATDSDAVSLPQAPLVGAPNFAAGPDAGGGPTVTYYNPDGSAKFSVAAFDAAFTGGVRVAVGDFNGDGVPDLAVGTGPGAATRVRVLDGVTKAELFTIDPFEASFTGGVFVAAGDITGDGKAELIITPDEGGGPRVRIFNGGDFKQLADFFGIDDPAFRGGARSAVGDVNGDGKGDLLVAAGFGGGPRIAVFDGKTLFDPLPAVVGALPPKLFGDFFVFENTLRNGVFFASGDLDGDGFAEVIAGGGPGGGPRVFALGGKGLLSGTQTQLANFFAGDTASRGGIRLAVKNLDGDTRADLVVGAGTGAGSRVTGYLGKNIPADGTPPERFAFDAFAGFTGGVFVG